MTVRSIEGSNVHSKLSVNNVSATKIGFSHWLHGSIRQVIVYVFLQYQPRTFEFKPDPGVVMGASS